MSMEGYEPVIRRLMNLHLWRFSGMKMPSIHFLGAFDCARQCNIFDVSDLRNGM